MGFLQSCREQELLSSYGTWALECMGFSSWGTRAWLPCGIWDLPRAEIEPVFSASAGKFVTTGPPGKSVVFFFFFNIIFSFNSFENKKCI